MCKNGWLNLQERQSGVVEVPPHCSLPRQKKKLLTGVIILRDIYRFEAKVG